jgi:hypothetical protein
MSAWRNLTDGEIWQKDPVIHSSESDPWTNTERNLGIRIFARPGQKICAEDLDSGFIGIGNFGSEAIASLRSKFPQI